MDLVDRSSVEMVTTYFKEEYKHKVSLAYYHVQLLHTYLVPRVSE